MLEATTITAVLDTAKANDELVLISLTDGTTASGAPISVNSKGVNIKADGKVRSFSLKRVVSVQLVTDDEVDVSDDALENVPEDIAEMLHDGMTTAELAELLDTTPKALRVELRALGMGVGKGRKYSLTPSAYIAVRNRLAEVPATA